MSLLTSDPVEAEYGLTVFDATTSLAPARSRADRFDVQLHSSWSSLVGIHGGYLAAIAIKAAQRVADRPIRTVTTTFLRPGSIGAATVDVEVVRRGRSITNLTVTLSQASKAVLISQVVAADVLESTSWETVTPPDLPDFDDCIPLTPPDGIRHFDHADNIVVAERQPEALDASAEFFDRGFDSRCPVLRILDHRGPSLGSVADL